MKNGVRNTNLGNQLIKEYRAEANPRIAEHSQRFFKTGKGEYGEGDVFLGIRVPVTRRYAKKYIDLNLKSVLKLLKSKYHEERLLAVILLSEKFKKGDATLRKEIFNLYMSNTRYINNWDIIDSSAHWIVGPSLDDNKPSYLKKLAKSKSLWERRIAIMATFHFIKQKQFNSLLIIAKILLKDEEDLIHKAVGWMLREAGKRDLKVEEGFLKEHYKSMPRTMLRYAIEKFSERKRQAYLKGNA